MNAEYMEFLEDNEELWKVYDQSDVAGTPVVATNTPDDPSTTVATPTDTIHVDSDPPASFVVIRWLNTPLKWSDRMEHQLRTFMIEHDFMHCSKRKDRDQTLLNQITTELKAWFDPSDWQDAVHGALLKEKVCNKMHRIRSQLSSQDPIRKLQDGLEGLQEDDYERALHLVFSTIGRGKVQAALATMQVTASSSL